MIRRPPRSTRTDTRFPYTTLFRSSPEGEGLETEKNMTLRAAVQMDPMDNINIGGDSSFALILKALERGYELYHYDVRGLTWEAGRLTTKDRKSTRLNSSH